MFNSAEVHNDIVEAGKIVEKELGHGCIYNKHSKVPLKGTENLVDLYQFGGHKQDFTKSLIVAGSGDQAIEAILHGAKVINTFDINRLAYYGASLKYAARKALSYDEFMAFYCLNFPENLFVKVKRYLSPDVVYFFEILFDIYGKKTIYDYLFDSANHDGVNAEKHISAYIREKYDEIRKKMHEVQITFTETNLLDIHNTSIVKDKYDFIYLSNIVHYLNIPINDYVEYIKGKVVPLLAGNGRLVLDYVYKQYIDMNEVKGLFDMIDAIEDIDRFETFKEELSNVDGVDFEPFRVDKSGYGGGNCLYDMSLTLKRKNAA